jgi:hypothetical protein
MPERNARWFKPGRQSMHTRRSVLLASIAAGVAMNSKDALAKAAQPSTPVNFDVPAGALVDNPARLYGFA